MKIIHLIDDITKLVFPEITNLDEKSLSDFFIKQYGYGSIIPIVKINDHIIEIEIDNQTIDKQQKEFSEITDLCDLKKYTQAKPRLDKLIKENPSVSEFHRVLGQIHFDENHSDEALNKFIDALKWDSKNTKALLMLGNLYARHQVDYLAAENFYKKVIELEPNNNLAYNNLAGLFANQKKSDQALPLFEKAYSLDPKYSNTLYGLALCYYYKREFLKSFEYSILCLKSNPDEGLSENNLKLMNEVVIQYSSSFQGKNIIDKLISELEERSGKKINLIQDNDIVTPAKIEIAEYHNKNIHTLKYKSKSPTLAHLVLHELLHLKLVLDARDENANDLFTSNNIHKLNFIKKCRLQRNKFNASGLSEEKADDFFVMIFHGILSQMYNAPIDLFIEQIIFNEYPELKPLQYLSLITMQDDAIQGANDKMVKNVTPDFVRDANIILTYTQLFQFKELYGVDRISKINEPALLKHAKELYKDYLSMIADKSAGEEYDLIKWWGEDLKLTQYFALVPEESDVNNKTLEEVLKKIKEDPFNLNPDSLKEDKEMQSFLKSQNALDVNMAVMMYMVDVIGKLKPLSAEKIKEIAFEIASYGRLGIDPYSDQKHKLASFPDLSFSGFHLLALMYVSWALHKPEMIVELKLPYHKEYELANKIINS